ncbi:hypothetical protein PCURB6_42910 [Paenibacillus curdlanolyticus]|nr:hypothetical protein PCURB6_42910 [Paenibacillus curdlanolyticus]
MLLVLAAHAAHLLVLPLLAAWLGINASWSQESGTSPLGSHAFHTGRTDSVNLPVRWASDLLAAATVAAAISMCSTMARSWRNVRSHPISCILYTLAAMLCIGLLLL